VAFFLKQMVAAAYGKCDFPPFDLAEEGADDGGFMLKPS